MPSLRQLAAVAQSQNMRERVRAALWHVADARLAAALPMDASAAVLAQHEKVLIFARAASRFTEQWIPLFSVRVLQRPEVAERFLELTADSNMLDGATEAALDSVLLAAVDAVFDDFADMPN